MSEINVLSSTFSTTSISVPTLECSAPTANAFSFKLEDSISSKRTPRTRRSSTTTCPDSPTYEQDGSQDEFSSTDAGDDDISVVFAEATSDSEQGDDFDPNIQTCVYSVLMLLSLRSVSLRKDPYPHPVQYSARYISEPRTPVAAEKPQDTPKAQKAPTSKRGAAAEPWKPSSRVRAQNAPRAAVTLPEATAGSWAAQQRRCTADVDATITRAARSILNKLTVEKFEPLLEQLTSCGFQQPHHISMLMREIFEKATIQHHFIPMYADLCVRLEKDAKIASVVKEAGELHSFRRLLLNQCQIVFEQVLEPRSVDTDNADADGEENIRRKQRALGNMKLIGHLLVHGMLSPELLAQCCEELLRSRKECPEALEALVALVWVAGPKFDTKSCQFYSRIEKIVMEMGALTKDKHTPPRLRFLIRDVLDSRDAGWPSSTAGPAKLSEVSNAEAQLPRQVSPKKQDVAAEKGRWATPKTVCQSNATGNRLEVTKVESVTTRGDKIHKFESSVETPECASEHVFDVVAFRRTLSSVFSELALDKNIPAATQRIRMQHVPRALQADTFVDIITRVVEERRGAIRRCQLAFAASLVAGDCSAFDRKEALEGVKLFFKDVYDDLCEEVQRLPAIMKAEFIPTMMSVLPADELNSALPEKMRK